MYLCQRFWDKSGPNEAFAYSKDVLEVWPQIDVIKRIMQMST